MLWLLLLSSLTTALAWVVVGGRKEHKPIAWFLTISLFGDLGRLVVHGVLASHRGEVLTGWVRGAADLDNALFLSWHAAFAWIAIRIFATRRAWPVVVVWAAYVIALAAFYPLTRGDVLRRCYLAAELASLFVALRCVLPWLGRWERPQVEHASGLVIIVVELANLIGPWLGDPFRTWNLAQAVYVIQYGALIMLQGGAAWSRSSERRFFS